MAFLLYSRSSPWNSARTCPLIAQENLAAKPESPWKESKGTGESTKWESAVWNKRERKLYLNCGTLKGRRRLLTTGGTSLDFGSAGLLAQRAALVNWETKEKFRSGPDVVRKTFLIFDLSPEDGGDRGAVGRGITCALSNTFHYSPWHCHYSLWRPHIFLVAIVKQILLLATQPFVG